MGAIDSERENRIYNELVAEKVYVEPLPDLVEGIFYLNKRSIFDKCSKDKLKAVKKQKIVVYDRRSLFLFDHETRFRKTIVQITGSNIFESIIVLAIAMNSGILAITDYNDRLNETEYN